MAKKKKVYKHVLGIDIGGGTRMGVALVDNETGELLEHDTIKPSDTKNHRDHRYSLIRKIKEYDEKYGIDILIFESIRLFSKGHIMLQTILSLNKVQTTVINEFSDNFDIYQVDVRSWKARVLGNANSDKIAAINYVKNKYPFVDLFVKTVHPKKKEIEWELNADLADSICIGNVLRFDSDILQSKNKLNYK